MLLVWACRYCDGRDEAGIEAVFDCLPHLAHLEGCSLVGGYIPTIPALVEMKERKPGWRRATQTQQWEYHWRPCDYV